jgi:hypothetical protein
VARLGPGGGRPDEASVVLDRNSGSDVLRLDGDRDLTVDESELYELEMAPEIGEPDATKSAEKWRNAMALPGSLTAYSLPSGVRRWRQQGLRVPGTKMFFEPDVVFVCDGAMILRAFARTTGAPSWVWGSGTCDVSLVRRRDDAPAELFARSFSGRLRRFARGGAAPAIIRNTFRGTVRSNGKAQGGSWVWFGDRLVVADHAGRYAVSVEGRGEIYIAPDIGGGSWAIPFDARQRDRVLNISHDEDEFGATR